MRLNLVMFRDKIGKVDYFFTFVSIFLAAIVLNGLGEKSKVGGWNVDDYLYGMVTRNLGNPLQEPNWIQNFLNTGQNSPLLPGMASFIPMKLASLEAYSVVQVPILIALFWSLKKLTQILEIKSPNLIAATIITIPTFVAWSVMYHFALISTLFVVTTVFLYIDNVDFKNSVKNVLFGLSIGCLSLSRSIALVYVFAIVLSIVLHQITLRIESSKKGIILALGSSIFIASPWWFTSGLTALQYLVGSGYPAQDGSRFTFSLLNVTNRISASAQDMGYMARSSYLYCSHFLFSKYLSNFCLSDEKTKKWRTKNQTRESFLALFP